MSFTVRREIDEVFECIDCVFEMRKRIAAVASPREHFISTQNILLRKLDHLCMLLSTIHQVRPKPEDLEVLTYITKVVEVKSQLHVFFNTYLPDVRWAALDEAISAAYRPLVG